MTIQSDSQANSIPLLSLIFPSFLSFANRMDDPFCLSALRSPFYQLQGGGGLPPLHPSAVHMHLPGVRYPGDLTHPSLSALQSERLSERYSP